MLELVQLKNRSTGDEIFKEIINIFENFNLDINRLVSITTDGARNLTGVNKGLVTKMKEFFKEKGILRDPIGIHCILHQENLCQNIELENVIELGR